MEPSNLTTDNNQSDESGIVMHEIPQWALDIELVYLVFILVIGIPGNSLVVLVQMQNKEKTSTDYYVMFMAGFDLLCSSVNTSLRIFTNTRAIWIKLVSSFVCTIRSFFVYTTTMSSVFLLAAIAIDRYIKTCRPLTTFYNTKKAEIVCVIISFGSIVCSFHSIGTYYVKDSYACAVQSKFSKFKNYFDVVNLMLTVVVYIVVIISYTCVSVTLSKRHKERVKARLNMEVSLQRNENSLSLFRNNRVSPFQAPDDNNHAQVNNEALVDSGVESEPYSSKKTCALNASQTSSSSAINQGTINNFNKTAVKCQTDSAGVAELRKGRELNLRAIMLQERIVNRTTRIMFLITVIFILTWIMSWLRILLGPSVLGAAFNNFARSLFMLNCVTNPVLFYCMSSRFRVSTHKFLRCRKL